MAKEKGVGESTAQVISDPVDSGRPPGGDLRDAAEQLHTRLDVVRAYLKVMSGMATSAICGTAATASPLLLQIEADAFDLVMDDLAKRCREAGEAALELGYGRKP